MANNSPTPQTPSQHLSAPRPFTPTLHQRSPGVSTGSATQTLTNTPQRSESPEPLILRLRGAHNPQRDSASDNTTTTQTRRPRPHIQWAEDVIDNEGLGRKKSKVCCIYHKPRPVGESSDESSSDDSDSSSGDDSDAGQRDGARPVGGNKGRGHKHNHGSGDNGDGCGHGHGKNRKQTRRPSPNAYERVPKYDVQPLTQQPGRMS